MPICRHGPVTRAAMASGSRARSAPTGVSTTPVPDSSSPASRSQAAVPAPEACAGARTATPSAVVSPRSSTGASSSWQRSTTDASAAWAAATTARSPSRTSCTGTDRRLP